MIFDRNENKDVIALLGAGSMGTAIVKRIATGKKILLGDISEKNLEKVSNEFKYGGYDVETKVVNALEKDSVNAFAEKAASLGKVMYFIDTAGLLQIKQHLNIFLILIWLERAMLLMLSVKLWEKAELVS